MRVDRSASCKDNVPWFQTLSTPPSLPPSRPPPPVTKLSMFVFFFYYYFYSHCLDEKSVGKRKLDLVAVISGGAEVTRGLHNNITLIASLSYESEVAHGNRSGMKFTWHFGKFTGNRSSKRAEAKAEKDFFTAVNESAIHYYGKAFGEQISLNTKALSVNQTYIVKLVVIKDSRISTVYQVIHLIEGDPPEIYQRLGIYFVCFCCYLVRLVCFY